MKKLILSACMIVAMAFTASAQEISPNALGLRIGDNDGFGGELSYQRAMGSNNRLELDLGWRNSEHYDALKITGLYQWVWNIDGGFNWYAGVGAGLGTFDGDKKYFADSRYDKNSGTFALLAGDIGIEYLFDFPLQISLDLRPELYFGGKYRTDNFAPDIALGLRYRF